MSRRASTLGESRAAAGWPQFEIERGSILVMCAVMIPVFLLLTALVVDVGNWYTHKRQLQNRADAGAFAAGVEYARNWKACVQTGDPALRASTARRDRRCRARVRGRPRGLRLRTRDSAGDAAEHRDREPGEPRRRHQLERPELHRRHRLHRRRRLAAAGQPLRPAHDRRRHLRARPLDGRPRQGARPAVALRLDRPPALAQRRPCAGRDAPRDQRHAVPAARGAEQRDHQGAGAVLRRVPRALAPTLLATRDLAPLPATTRVGSPRRWRHALGPPERRQPSVGDPNQAFNLTLPSYGGCGQAYLPVGVEVRIASRNEIDLDANTCAQLLAMQYADCFSRLSQIRVWNDGNADNQVRIGDVHLTGGCGNADGVLRHAPRRRDELPLRRERLRQLGRRDDATDEHRRPGQLHRHGQRRRRDPPGADDQAGGYSVWTGAEQRAHRERRRQHGHRRTSTGRTRRPHT